MSSRTTDTYIFAEDSQGKLYDVMRNYSYAGGSYHQVVQIKEAEYDVVSDGAGDTQVKGTYLPVLDIADLASYFETTPTEKMRFVIGRAGLSGADIVKFYEVSLFGTTSSFYSATLCSVTAKDNFRFDYDDASIAKAIAKRELTNKQ